MDRAYDESVQLAGLARFTGMVWLIPWFHLKFSFCLYEADPLAEILAQATSISSAWSLI